MPVGSEGRHVVARSKSETRHTKACAGPRQSADACAGSSSLARSSTRVRNNGSYSGNTPRSSFLLNSTALVRVSRTTRTRLRPRLRRRVLRHYFWSRLRVGVAMVTNGAKVDPSKTAEAESSSSMSVSSTAYWLRDAKGERDRHARAAGSARVCRADAADASLPW
jgi:hypothetical protein